VARHQRARLHAATIELVDEGGYEALTVTAIARAAGVSNRIFYENFEDKGDCFLSTYDRIVRHVVREVLVAQRGKDDCRGKLEAGLAVLTREVAEQPKAARLALIEVFAIDASLARVRRTHGLFEALLAESCNIDPDAPDLPQIVVMGIVAGISSVARSRLIAGEGEKLADDTGRLLEWILSFHGKEARAILPRRAQLQEPRSRRSARPGRLEDADAGTDDRGMILSAVSKIAADEGYAALTVPRIRGGAGISRRRFDEHFDGVNDCFLAALELRLGRVFDRARGVYLEADEWAPGVHRAAVAICQQIADDPVLVKLAFFELLVSGRAALSWRADLATNLASALCRTAPSEMCPTDLAAEASVAAAWGVMQHYATSGRASQLPQVAPTVSYLLLAPFIGVEAAVDVATSERQQTAA
jgi:AcrR family transcriptional regulator